MLKTIINLFRGFTPQYYFRQLFFGLIIGSIYLYMMWNTINRDGVLSQADIHDFTQMAIFAIVSTLLYPYSRFAYEEIVGFLLGRNIFFINSIVYLLAKVMTMITCWALAIFIFPLGLLFIYYYQKQKAKENSNV